MEPDIQIASLRTLLAVVDEGGFEAAANKIGRTQSAVTQQMQRLELAVGKPLFRAKGRKRELTQAGLTLVRYGREIVSMSRHALTAISSAGDSGILRVGTPHELVDALLPEALIRFNEMWPEIRVVMHVDRSPRLMTMLQENRLEVAITTRRVSYLEGTHVKTLKPVWLAAPTFRRDTRTPVPLALTDEPSLFRRIALAALDLGSVPYAERFTSPSLTGLRPAVIAGLGVTVRPAISFSDNVMVIGEEQGLPPLPDVEYFGYLRKETSPQHANDFLQILKSVKV